MRTFSKIVFICNCCFVVAVLMRLIELSLRKGGNPEVIIPLHSVVASILVLGLFLSLILDVVFLFIVALKKVMQKPLLISTFILYFNLIMLPIEIWYNFIWKTA
jgi:hypothetical protein